MFKNRFSLSDDLIKTVTEIVESNKKVPRNKPFGLVEEVEDMDESFDLSDFSLEELMDFMMSEEYEQLDEISKKTLSSYVKKASSDMANNAYTLGARDPLRKPGSWNKAFKRKAGIEKAADRLAKEEVELDEKAYVSSLSPELGRKGSHDVIGKDGKVVKSYPYTKDGMKAAQAHLSKMKEEVELDELSKKTLGSYINKSASDISHIQREIGSVGTKSPDYKGLSKMRKNRKDGIARAVKKLTKEAAELDEARTKFVIKHKKTKEVLSTHSNYNDAKDEHSGISDKQNYGIFKQTKKDAALHNRNTYREEVELDEVLDTPKAMDSYKNKANRSLDRASNSAIAKMLRNPKGPQATDISKETETMDKRKKGLKMADRAAARKTRAMLMKKEEVELDEISNKTLTNYAKASYNDVLKRRANRPAGKGDESDPKIGKRLAMNKLAHKKGAFKEDFDLSDFTLDELEDFMMSEDFDQLDEVSKKTLASYIRKASDDRAHNALEIGKTGKINFKGLKRRQGINRATVKLAKEEVELDEVTDQERLSARKIQRDAQTARHGIARKPGESMVAYLNRAKKHQEKMQKEEIELDEDISKMPHSRLKWHMNTGVPHGSYTKDEMKAEKERRMKTGEGDAYKKAKPALESAHKMYNSFASFLDEKKHKMDPVGKADADIDNDGDVDNSDKYLHNRRKAIGKSMKKDKIELNPKEKQYKGEM